MKNKNNKKHCKDCECNEVALKKVKTMENGKEYYEEVEEKEIETSKENEDEDE